MPATEANDPPPHHHAQSGLSLLEVLISLSLIAVMLVFITGGLQLSNRVWHLTSDVQKQSVVEPVRSFLRSSLERARPVFVPGLERNNRLEFDGQSNSVRFIVNRAGNVTLGGLHVVEIYVAEVGRNDTQLAGRHLMLRQYIYRPNPAQQKTLKEKSEPRVLLQNVSGLKLSYFGAESRKQEPSWRESWSGLQTLPNLVDITVAFEKDDPRRWARMLVSMRLL